MPYYKICCWDFDGPINRVDLMMDFALGQQPPPGYVVYANANICIANINLLKITLNVLADFGVKSVLATQRMLYTDQEEVRFLQPLYPALNDAFGLNRRFLTQIDINAMRQTMSTAAGQLQNISEAQDKLAFLNAVKNLNNGINNNQIVLIDDTLQYTDAAKEAGYGGIWVDMNQVDDKDFTYLAEILYKCIPKQIAIEGISRHGSNSPQEANYLIESIRNLSQSCCFSFSSCWGRRRIGERMPLLEGQGQRPPS